MNLNAELKTRKKIAKSNYKKYPTISQYFELEWIQEKLKSSTMTTESFNSHPLVWLLSYPEFDRRKSRRLDQKIKIVMKNLKLEIESGKDDMLAFRGSGMISLYKHRAEPSIVLAELETNMKLLKGKVGFEELVKKAKNGDQFWSTLSEFEVIANFERCKILKEIEPTIAGKTPDCSIEIDGKLFAVEVFTPRMPDKMREVLENGGGAFVMPNRVGGSKGLIDRKISQMPDIVPNLLVINSSYSVEDWFQLEEAVEGSSSVMIQYDTRTGKGITTDAIDDDGIHTLPNSDKISGIAMYKRIVDVRMRRKTDYIIKESFAAKIPLNDSEKKRLIKTFGRLHFIVNRKFT